MQTQRIGDHYISLISIFLQVGIMGNINVTEQPDQLAQVYGLNVEHLLELLIFWR